MGATRQRQRTATTGRALVLTLVSVPVPGLAHLRTGRRRAGAALLVLFAALALSAGAAALLLHDDPAGSLRLAAQGRWLLATSMAVFAVAVLWMTVIVHSWVITRPPAAGRPARFTGAALVVLLCLAVALPSGAAIRTAYTAHDTVDAVFGPERPDAPPHDESDPWDGRERINVLLLGGDSGDSRYGLRTDSMMVASVDVEYGDVVLIGLPRNLENVPFPDDTPLARAYPEPQGFDGLLNDVYQTVAEDPERLAIDTGAEDPAADTLKRTVADAVGLDIGYYALVDMQGFDDLVDAIGGVDVHIDEPIPYGEQGDVLKAGDRHLDGNEALWYGRSRTDSDDYTRMGRQGCLIKHVAEQADPVTVLTSFQELAGATKRTLRTDIPQSKAGAFIDLAELTSGEGGFKTLQLSPPQVDTAYPDWEKIRGLVDDAVADQERSQPSDDSGAGTPSGSPASPGPAEDGDAEPGSADSGASVPDTPGRQVGEDAASLDRLCP
ncbi:LCP family protein [Streptomonospora salina]|uniref:LCP family protein required for cell wall assembly n=1 Tax=Streptomonospora salina TaxID=104205 RepID=A0A841E6U1_9ACTN|nr:LCP family protein [Streptomonospora salina]MBB5998164.1 LCP family protein required for cell wall assembly [Streptomonospora salina]